MDLRRFFLLLFSLFNHQKMGGCRDFVSSYFNITEEELEETIKNFDRFHALESDVKFLLYPPSSNQTKDITHQDALKHINPNNPSKIIIHGYTNNGKKVWIQKMASLYHQKGNYNVIAIDWSINAKVPYRNATAFTKSVGSIIGQFLLNITRESPNFLETVHLIGHSLGGQVAGFVGKEVSLTGRLVDRITGLDVAAPIFETPVRLPSSLRLNPSDARFVDLIHTNAGVYGVKHNYGHVDFFVNCGGPIQPMCHNPVRRKANSCSHQSCHEFFAQTILNPKKYSGFLCAKADGLCNCNITAFMGDEVGRDAMGIFNVKIDYFNDDYLKITE